VVALHAEDFLMLMIISVVKEILTTELGIHLPDPDDKRWEEFYSFYSEKL